MHDPRRLRPDLHILGEARALLAEPDLAESDAKAHPPQSQDLQAEDPDSDLKRTSDVDLLLARGGRQTLSDIMTPDSNGSPIGDAVEVGGQPHGSDER